VIAASAAGGSLAAAQQPPGGAGPLTPPLPRTATIAPPPNHRADPELQTHVVRAGPFYVDGYGVVKRADRVTAPAVAGSIVGMDARIVDARGEPVAQHVVMLHHFLMTNGGADDRRRDGACPHRPVNERFYGTSEELRALTLPRGYGYPTNPRDRWRMIWMVMNHRAEARRIFVEYRVTVDPAPLTPVRPYWLSVVPCLGDSQYTVQGAGTGLHRRMARLELPEGGRIVAVGGHLHGGGVGLRVGQPRCGDRVLAMARPAYAPADDPLYAVRPLLHEPDPKDMSWWQSAQGWPVVRGEPLKVTAIYDSTRPHMRVMGIAHVYVAQDAAAARNCAARPTDAVELGAPFPGARSWPPHVRLTLARRGSDGRAREISRPLGALRRTERGANVKVRHTAFAPANLSVAAGSVVRWGFGDRIQHDVTVVSGPRGFSGPYATRGASYRRRLDVAGEYRLYCSLHPTVMAQLIRVRPHR
jgi:plastocyanin